MSHKRTAVLEMRRIGMSPRAIASITSLTVDKVRELANETRPIRLDVVRSGGYSVALRMTHNGETTRLGRWSARTGWDLSEAGEARRGGLEGVLEQLCLRDLGYRTPEAFFARKRYER